MAHKNTGNPLTVHGTRVGAVVTGDGAQKPSGKFSLLNNTKMLLAAFVVVFGGIGAALLIASHADTLPKNGYIFTGLYSISPDGSDYVGNQFPADASGDYATISRDGRHIAYQSNTSHKIVSYNTATPTQQQTYTLPGTVSYVSRIKWSPDGNWILTTYTDGTGKFSAYAAHPDGTNGATITLPTGAYIVQGKMDWMPDSNSLMYLGNSNTGGINNTVCTIKLDSTGNQCTDIQNSTAVNGLYAYDLATSIDGKTVAVVGSTSDNSSQTNIYIVSADGTTVQQITHDVTGLQSLAWSPDGTRLAYGTSSASGPGIYTVLPDGTQPVKVANSGQLYGGNLTWPLAVPGTQGKPLPPAGLPIAHKNGVLLSTIPINDGRSITDGFAISTVNGQQVAYIAYTANVGHSLNTGLINGTSLKKDIIQLGADGWKIAGWSPDGQWLSLVHSTTDSVVDELWVVHPDGSDLRRVVGSIEDMNAAQVGWASDSQHLVYTKIVSGYINICSVDIDGSAPSCKPTTVAEPTGESHDDQIGVLAVSPDGTKIVFSVPTLNTSNVITDTALYGGNVDGSNVTKLQDYTSKAVNYIDWSPDGTKLAIGESTFLSYASSSASTTAYIANTDGSNATVSTVAAGQQIAVWQPLPLSVKHIANDYTGSGLATTKDGPRDIGTAIVWSIMGSADVNYGVSGDIPVPADYTGDGKTDIAVWRPSTGGWYIRGNSAPVIYGIQGDIPVPADYTGDGTADIAVWRPSNGKWYVRGQTSVTYGQMGDIPIPADYDGDGRVDFAVFRPSTATFYYISSRTGVHVSKQYGIKGDVPVPGDYEKAGVANIAVYRPSNSTFYYHNAAGSTVTVQVGRPNDIPQVADYNGDGKTDPAVHSNTSSGLLIAGQPLLSYAIPLNTFVSCAASVFANITTYTGCGKAPTTIGVNTSADLLVTNWVYDGYKSLSDSSAGTNILVSSGNGYTYEMIHFFGGLRVYANATGKLSIKTLVASPSDEGTDPDGGKLILTKDGNLVMEDTHNKNKVVWQSNTSKKGVVKMVLSNYGNLDLVNAAGKTVWQSSAKFQ